MWHLVVSLGIEFVAAFGTLVLLSQIEAALPPNISVHLITLLCDLVKIAGAFTVSCHLGKGWKWWGRWWRLDTVTPLVFTTALAYAMVCLPPGITDYKSLDVAAVVMSAVGYLCVCGNLRVMLKYFEWTTTTITIYKVMRGLALTMIVIYQTIDVYKVNPRVVAYFGSALGLNMSLLGLVVGKADEVRKAEKEKATSFEDSEVQEMFMTGEMKEEKWRDEK